MRAKHRLGSGARAVLDFAAGTTSRMRRGSLAVGAGRPTCSRYAEAGEQAPQGKIVGTYKPTEGRFVRTYTHLAITVSSGRCVPGKRDVTRAIPAMLICHAARADQSVTGCQWHASPMDGGVSEGGGKGASGTFAADAARAKRRRTIQRIVRCSVAAVAADRAATLGGTPSWRPR